MYLTIHKGPVVWQSVSLVTEEADLPKPVLEQDAVWFELADVADGYEFSLTIGDEQVDGTPERRWVRPPGGEPTLCLAWQERSYFDRYAGVCRMQVASRSTTSPIPEERVWRVLIHVVPSKVTQEEFDHLVDDLTRLRRGLVYDIWGRANLGVALEKTAQSLEPEEQLNRIREFITKATPLLGRVRLTPAHRVEKSHNIVEDAGLSLDTESSAWLMTHPDEISLVPSGGRKRPAIRRVLRANASRNVDIYENRVIRSAIQEVLERLDRLASLATREIAILEGERSWKDLSRGGDGSSWWQEYNLPRIAAAKHRLKSIQSLQIRAQELLRGNTFLSRVAPERGTIRLTPLFHQHPDYAALYRSIRRLKQGVRFALDDSVPIRIRDIPTLYETWCYVRVAVALASRVAPASAQPAIHMADDRYSLQISSDHPLVFRTPSGVFLRLFAQRKYWVEGIAREGYGRLTNESQLYLPDISLEFYQSEHDSCPFAIYIFDAKYKDYDQTPWRQSDDWSKMWRYANEIGSFADYQSLVRHAWVLSANRVNQARPQFPGFFGADFRPRQTVGTIPMRPDYDVSQFLRVFDRLLELDGISLR